MNTRIYPIDISILIKPIWFDRVPTGKIGINGNIKDFEVQQETWFDFKFEGVLNETCQIRVEHYGKTDSDTDIINNRDTALIVEQVKLNEFNNPKFAWAGKYQPNYPEGWINQNKGAKLQKILSPHTYLGWNGVWTLDITLPVYTWIHQIDGLGWIYD